MDNDPLSNSNNNGDPNKKNLPNKLPSNLAPPPKKFGSSDQNNENQSNKFLNNLNIPPPILTNRNSFHPTENKNGMESNNKSPPISPPFSRNSTMDDSSTFSRSSTVNTMDYHDLHVKEVDSDMPTHLPFLFRRGSASPSPNNPLIGSAGNIYEKPTNLPPPPKISKKTKELEISTSSTTLQTISTLANYQMKSPVRKEKQQELTVPRNIASFKFMDYCMENFNLPKKPSKNEISKLTSFSKKSISYSLHLFSFQKNLKATEIFDKLLSYGKKKANETDWDSVLFILYTGLNEVDLRDEIYCQVLKQMRNAPDSFLVKMTEMIGFLSSTFIPSQKLRAYVLGFLTSLTVPPPISKTLPIDTIKKAIQNILKMEMSKVQRSLVPSVDFELTSVLKKIPILLPIILPGGGNQKKLVIDSTTTFSEILDDLLEKLSIPNGFGFAIYKKISKFYQKVASPDENICEAVSTVKAYEQQLKTTLPYNFLFRKRLFITVEPPSNEKEKRIIYQQAISSISDQSLPCQIADFAKLMALDLQYEYGDYEESKEYNGIIEERLPGSYFEKGKKEVEFIVSKVFQEYKLSKGFKKSQAVLNFLNHVKLLPLYGTALYPVKVVKITHFNDMFVDNLQLGINRKGILFYDEKKILHEHPYSRIVNWEYDPNKSCITFTIRGYDGKSTKNPSDQSIYEENFESTCVFNNKFKFHEIQDLPPVPSSRKNTSQYIYPSKSEKVLMPRGFFAQWSVTLNISQAEEVIKLIEDYTQYLLENSTASVAIVANKSPMNEMLSFEKGEIITVKKKNTNGWFEGKDSSGKEGIFCFISIYFFYFLFFLFFLFITIYFLFLFIFIFIFIFFVNNYFY